MVKRGTPKPTGGGAKNKRADRRKSKFGGGGGAAVPRVSEGGVSKKITKQPTNTDEGVGKSGKPTHGSFNKLSDVQRSDKGKMRTEEASRPKSKGGTKPHALTIQELSLEWEKHRSKKVPEANRKKVIADLAKRVKGKVAELGTNHKSARVIQAIIKQGSQKDRDAIFEEVSNPKTILFLATSSYGSFIVRALLDSTPKKDLTRLLAHFRGNVVKLARHPCGSAVLEMAYSLSNAVQRSALVAEFYGPEFALKAHAAIVSGGVGSEGLRLKDALSDPSLGGRMAVITFASRVLAGVWEKGMVAHAFVHRVLAEYLEQAPASMVVECLDSLAGDVSNSLVRMMHTLDGAKAANIMIQHASAKHKKKILKSMKGLVPKVAHDEYGRMVVLCLMDTVDDTVLMNKTIIAELQKDLFAVASSKSARLCLLHLLAPRSPRYLPSTLTHLLPQISEAGDVVPPPNSTAKAQKPKDDGGEEGASGKKRARQDADGDEEEEEEVAAAGPLAKKPMAAKRKELLGGKGGLGEAMVKMCTEHAKEMVVDRSMSDVLAEVVGGGANDALLACTSKEAFTELYEAVASVASDGDKLHGGSDDEEDDKEPSEPVLVHYVGSRVMRRLVLTQPPEGVKCFGSVLWAKVLKGNCKKWIGTHAEKVMAALADCGDSKTQAEVTSELAPLVKPMSTLDWLAKFKGKPEASSDTVQTSKGKKGQGTPPKDAAGHATKPTATNADPKMPTKGGVTPPAKRTRAAKNKNAQ